MFTNNKNLILNLYICRCYHTEYGFVFIHYCLPIPINVYFNESLTYIFFLWSTQFNRDKIFLN